MSRLADHARRTQQLARALARHAPPPGDGFACPYLAGREARNLAFGIEPCPAGLYHALMDLNFRRMGPVFYRPACIGCHECRMLRVRVESFRPSRSQRRCLRRNADLDVEVGEPGGDSERLELYRRYLEARHDGHMSGSPEEFETFLGRSPLETLELRFRSEGRLLAVGLADVEPLALSAVYSYFEPSQGSRSLGVLTVLRLVEEARRRGLPYLYLGYHVRGCAKMAYKAAYRPCELLGDDGRWRAP